LALKRAVFAGLAVLGAVLLAAAEFSPVYHVVVGSLEIVRRSVQGADNHSYALLIIAALALPMALGALRGSRPAALALIALGAGALYVTLALDLPDARATGQLKESALYEDAKAKPARGLYLEAAGGGVLVLSGLGFLLAVGRTEPRTPRAGRRSADAHAAAADEDAA
jgi:hypothetical protein